MTAALKVAALLLLFTQLAPAQDADELPPLLLQQYTTACLPLRQPRIWQPLSDLADRYPSWTVGDRERAKASGTYLHAVFRIPEIIPPGPGIDAPIFAGEEAVTTFGGQLPMALLLQLAVAEEQTEGGERLLAGWLGFLELMASQSQSPYAYDKAARERLSLMRRLHCTAQRDPANATAFFAYAEAVWSASEQSHAAYGKLLAGYAAGIEKRLAGKDFREQLRRANLGFAKGDIPIDRERLLRRISGIIPSIQALHAGQIPSVDTPPPKDLPSAEERLVLAVWLDGDEKAVLGATLATGVHDIPEVHEKLIAKQLYDYLSVSTHAHSFSTAHTLAAYADMHLDYAKPADPAAPVRALVTVKSLAWLQPRYAADADRLVVLNRHFDAAERDAETATPAEKRWLDLATRNYRDRNVCAEPNAK